MDGDRERRGKKGEAITLSVYFPARNSTNPSDARFPLVLGSFHPPSLLLYAPVVRGLYIVAHMRPSRDSFAQNYHLSFPSFLFDRLLIALSAEEKSEIAASRCMNRLKVLVERRRRRRREGIRKNIY